MPTVNERLADHFVKAAGIAGVYADARSAVGAVDAVGIERRLGLWRPVSAGLAQTPVNPDIRLNFPVNSISIPVIR